MNDYTHFYLYAKGWYNRGDVMDDLRKITSNYSGSPASENDALTVLLHVTWDEILKSGNPRHQFEQIVRRPLGGGENSLRCLARACLALLADTIVKGRDLGEPDYSVLPQVESVEQNEMAN